MRSMLRLIAGFGLLASLGLAAPPAQSEAQIGLASMAPADPAPVPPRLSYRIYVGGFALAEASIDLEVAADRYEIEFAAKVIGVLNNFADFETVNRTEGAVTAEGFRPLRNTVIDLGGEAEKYEILEFEPQGGLQRRLVGRGGPDGPLTEKPVESFPSSMTRDTVDLLTAIAALLREAAVSGRCDAVVPVFDGNRRFDLVYRDRGDSMLTDSKYNIYAGAARRCSASVRLVEGEWKRRQRWVEEMAEESPDGGLISLWLGDIPDVPGAVPVRMEVYTPLGTGIAHLIGIEAAPETAE